MKYTFCLLSLSKKRGFFKGSVSDLERNLISVCCDGDSTMSVWSLFVPALPYGAIFRDLRHYTRPAGEDREQNAPWEKRRVYPLYKFVQRRIKVKSPSCGQGSVDVIPSGRVTILSCSPRETSFERQGIPWPLNPGCIPVTRISMKAPCHFSWSSLSCFSSSGSHHAKCLHAMYEDVTERLQSRG